jgi:sarcosine reductase
MTLTLNTVDVRDVRLGDVTHLEGGRLTLNANALAAELESASPSIADVRISIAHPGEQTRIVCVKDVIQPRAKRAGDEAGAGERYIPGNLAIVTTGPIVGFQEGIIDMSGPGAEYTPFSSMHLVVVEIDVAAGASAHVHESLIRATGLGAAEHVAKCAVGAPPDERREIEWDNAGVDRALPRLVYVYMVLSQGLLHDTYVMGRNAAEGLPATLDPRLVIDGALVSGNCVSACDKNTTFHHQNNPIVTELLAGHGTRWNFVGVVLTNASTRLAEKERAAAAAVDLTRGLEADGAVVSKEGFGNPDADLMMLLRGLEHARIKTVGVTDEFAGVDGASQSLADAAREADALVSTGNANERIVLPPMRKVIGPLPDVARLAGGYAYSLRDDGALEVELQAIVGATNQLGFSRLSCRGV